MICELPLQLLSVEEDGHHIMVTASVNGHPINMLVDTGASRTVFDMNRLDELFSFDPETVEKNERLSTGIGTNTLESHVVSLNELNLGGALFKNYQAVMIDLSQVNETYTSLKLPAIEGVLGGDILLKGKAMIDYKRKTLKLVVPKAGFKS